MKVKIIWPDTLLKVVSSRELDTDKLTDEEKARYITNIYVIAHRHLTPREQDILFMYFKEDKTCKEIGKIMGFTPQYIDTILLKIKRKLISRKTYIYVGDIMDKIKELETEYWKRCNELTEMIQETEEKLKILRIDVPEHIEKVLKEREMKLNTSMTIDELELSVRPYNCLRRAGYKYVSDLKGKKVEDIMKIRGLGRTSFQEIITKLKEHNLADILNWDYYDGYNEY